MVFSFRTLNRLVYQSPIASTIKTVQTSINAVGLARNFTTPAPKMTQQLIPPKDPKGTKIGKKVRRFKTNSKSPSLEGEQELLKLPAALPLASLSSSSSSSSSSFSSQSPPLLPKVDLHPTSSRGTTMDNKKKRVSKQLNTEKKPQKNTGTTSDVLFTLYMAQIELYFATTKFRMNQEQQKTLKTCMEKVYTKKLPLFCFDVEAWESNNNIVTEIGIAIYDPKGQESSAFPHIKQYHIITEEHFGKRNGRFVPDNKFNFVGGTTHVLPEKEVQQFLNRMIFQYFIVEKDRGAAFVGQHIGGDINWLKSIGVDFPEGAPIIDTYKIFQLSHGKTGGGLRQILRIMDIPHAYLHNAANDAYYTLLAALSWCDPHLRFLKKIDSHDVVDVYLHQQQLEGRTKAQQQEDKRRKRLEKFTDQSKVIRLRDNKMLQ